LQRAALKKGAHWDDKTKIENRRRREVAKRDNGIGGTMNCVGNRGQLGVWVGVPNLGKPENGMMCEEGMGKLTKAQSESEFKKGCHSEPDHLEQWHNMQNTGM
jgi:hypothetical protein